MSEGRKDDQGKIMVDLLVPEFLEDVARVMTMGAKKYGIGNWQQNLEGRRILAALYRHLLAYHRGEKRDPESGLNHLCHICANAMFLYWYDEVRGHLPQIDTHKKPCHGSDKEDKECRTCADYVSCCFAYAKKRMKRLT